jgi:hypothetical protein
MKIEDVATGFLIATVIGFIACFTTHYFTNNWWEKESVVRNIGYYDKEHKFQFKNCQEISSEMLDKWKSTKQSIEVIK